MARLVLENSFIRDDQYVAGGFWEGWPVEGQITQVFGQQSVTGSTHAGTDIGAGYGSTAYFPMAGLAIPQYWGSFGNWYTVECEYDDEYGQLYYAMAHFDHLELSQARWVEAGDVAGRVGNTGVSFGPHVHFAFSWDKFISADWRRCLDPYIFIKRAQEEQVIPEYLVGLMQVSLGDPMVMSAVYDALDNFRGTGISGNAYPAGFFYKLNQSDGTVDPIDGDATDLNDSIVRMKRIQSLAWGDKARGNDAWAIVK